MNITQIFNFLNDLQANNSKEWFDLHRNDYENIKIQLKKFVAEIIEEVSVLDPELDTLEPKYCLFRINRDVRFSANKSPYKNNIGMSITKGGKKSLYSGCYFHIQPGNQSFMAGGLYLPTAEILKKVRAEIDYNPTEIEKLLINSNFKKYFNTLAGDKLIKPPKGYEASHPQVELLKHKSFLGWHQISDKELLTMDVKKYFLTIFKSLMPLNAFLNKAVDFKE